MAKAYVWLRGPNLTTIHNWLDVTPIFIVQLLPVFEHIHLQIEGRTVEYLTIDVHPQCVQLIPQQDNWENAVECALVLKANAPAQIKVLDIGGLKKHARNIYNVIIIDPESSKERVPLALAGDDPEVIPLILELEV